VYESPPRDTPLVQGDLIDGCPLFILENARRSAETEAVPKRWVTRVVALTQACDLAQAKSTRVVVAPVYTAAQLVDQGVLKASSIRDQVRRGLVYGWYFLPAASTPMEFPESIVNLRELHTVSRSILEELIAEGRRVCRLQTPYREHLAQHFAVTYSRMALPEPYETQP
jgi:crotonobetainyl-CoA:carnitine CoA-transferase CaiB-like acyl-CoA transferase